MNFNIICFHFTIIVSSLYSSYSLKTGTKRPNKLLQKIKYATLYSFVGLTVNATFFSVSVFLAVGDNFNYVSIVDARHHGQWKWFACLWYEYNLH